MIEENEAFWRGIREAAGDDPRVLAVIRRCMKLLEPPYPEPEVTAARFANEIRAADKLLARRVSPSVVRTARKRHGTWAGGAILWRNCHKRLRPS
jgi:hypothetical protein